MVEDLLGRSTKTSNIINQPLSIKTQSITIPIYSLNKKEKMGTLDVKIPIQSEDVIALYADRDIKPFFKIGTIFIVDQKITIENDNLIAIKFDFQPYSY